MQPEQKTIQGDIEKALAIILRQPIRVVGCGRTDTGVHAEQYYLHFDTDQEEFSVDLVYKLNQLLDRAISIKRAIPVADKAHARFDASARSYIYHLHGYKSPFLNNSYQYRFRQDFDWDRVMYLANELPKYKDFFTFCKTNTDVKTTLCQITEMKWILNPTTNTYEFHVTSNRFLRGMIRLLVGAFLNVGNGLLATEEVIGAMEHKKRLRRDLSAPANGLFLCNIKYPFL